MAHAKNSLHDQLLGKLSPRKGSRADVLQLHASYFNGQVGEPKDIESQPLLDGKAAVAAVLQSGAAGKGQIDGTQAAPTRLATVLVITSWYVSNIGLLLMNKYLLSNYGFRRPVFLTLCHMLACMVMSSAAAWMEVTPPQNITSRTQLLKVSLLALVFSVSVVLGNVALRFIPVSFSQAIGATTPAFTAALAFVVLGTVETWGTYATLLPVIVGIVMATGAEPSFNMAGFLAGVTATAARAMKSVLQGVLLTDPSEKMDSMNLLRWMSPISLLVLLPGVAVLEAGVWREAWAQTAAQPAFLFFLAANAAMAYVVNLTNFLVTKHTSALTLQVLGNAKGVVAVVVSVWLFRNPVTVMGSMGYLITVFGVVLYATEKRRAREVKAKAAAAPHT